MYISSCFDGNHLLRSVKLSGYGPSTLPLRHSANIDLIISTNVLFNLSATPFCSGHFGMVSSCFIPSFFRQLLNSVEVNSPPFSVRRTFTRRPKDFSTSIFHSQNRLKITLPFNHIHPGIPSFVIYECDKVLGSTQ